MLLQPTIDTSNPAQVKKQLEHIARIMNFDVRFRAAVPVHNVSPGNVDDYASDATFFYVCVSKNLWKRVTLQADTW